jgi:hypothetical protein
VLGAVTFIRLVECGAEDFRYGMAINRIRAYYQEVAKERADLFLLSGHSGGCDKTRASASMSPNEAARHAPRFAFESSSGSNACLLLVLAIYLGVRPAAAYSR